MTDFLIEMFRGLSEYLLATFTGWGLSYDFSNLLKNLINFIFIGCISALSWYIAKQIIVSLIHKIVYRTSNKYDDQLVTHKVVEPLSQIFPAAYIYYLIQFAVSDPDIVERIRGVCFAWNIFSVLIILFRALDAVHDILTDILAQKQRKTNIKGYVQVVKILIGIFGGLGIISVLIGKNPLTLFGGLAGMSAILMLVFKDTISGFVASIQLTSLNMVKMNDWITIANRNIEGNVVEITLNTVKVRNFDNSVSTVPTASLMSESFINWSNMQEMEARRMKRTIMIDAESVKIADSELLNKLKNNSVLKDYILQREKESADINDRQINFDKREITNLELFRKYIEFYIKSNCQIFKKYKPTTITDEDGNTRELYIIDDKDEFLKLHGEAAQKYLMEYKGHTIIGDLSRFVSENRLQPAVEKLNTKQYYLEVDKKDSKVFYPVKVLKNTTFVNNTSRTVKVTKRILEKEGTFVENGHMMVRQMQQTSTGIPLEIYAFTRITEWASFEKMQSAFFEHLFAIIGDFQLKIFQFAKAELRENA